MINLWPYLILNPLPLQYKRDLLLTQIADSTPLDIIAISELLFKAPNAIVNLSLITLHVYHCYFNFDPNNYDPILSDI